MYNQEQSNGTQDRRLPDNGQADSLSPIRHAGLNEMKSHLPPPGARSNTSFTEHQIDCTAE